jgi:hypothetical protein
MSLATTTSEPLPQTASEQTELFPMSSAADSHAKTLAWQGGGQGSTKTPAADYGQSTPVLLAKYDHNTSSWRTSQHCLEGGLTAFSETWPRSGMMRSGTAYQLPPLVRLTDATGSGLWPTPNTSEAKSDTLNIKNRVQKGKQIMLCHAVRMFPTPAARDYKDAGYPAELNRNSVTLATIAGGSLNPMWVEWLMGFPTDHTALNASETPSSRKSQKSSGGQ